MLKHDVIQGSPEWHALRMTIPTASEFNKIVTPTGQLSKQARDYAFRLVTQKLLNRSMDSVQGMEWMERGRELEPEAARLYEFLTEDKLEVVGFCTTDDGKIGASPDRLIAGKRGLVEIKVPAPMTHVEYLIDGPDDKYRCQLQGQLLVTGYEYVDFFSYSPEMPPVRLRIERDEPFIGLLRRSIYAFCTMRDEVELRVRAAGYFEERARLMAMPQDVAYGDQADG